MGRVQPITIKVLQEKSRRTGPAEGEGEQHTKAAEERAAERLTIEESNNECLFGCRRKSMESSALTETQTLAYILWGFSRRKEGGNKRPSSRPGVHKRFPCEKKKKTVPSVS